MAAAAVISPVTLAAHTLRSLASRRSIVSSALPPPKPDAHCPSPALEGLEGSPVENISSTWVAALRGLSCCAL
jgi:hypothetical protein